MLNLVDELLEENEYLFVLIILKCIGIDKLGIIGMGEFFGNVFLIYS